MMQTENAKRTNKRLIKQTNQKRTEKTKEHRKDGFECAYVDHESLVNSIEDPRPPDLQVGDVGEVKIKVISLKVLLREGKREREKNKTYWLMELGNRARFIHGW